ncbi:ribonuclease P protein subunit [Candidatus Woesearchaeota archaeon]|nr:MAG: ribonuclease P protein subunit [Candidatus Woesearchaeota archaeon]
MNLKDVQRKELIGREIEVICSTNKDNVGIIGKIIDETKHTIIVKKDNAKKTIIKKNVTLRIKMNDKKIVVKGKALVGRPEDRIKKR